MGNTTSRIKTLRQIINDRYFKEGPILVMSYNQDPPTKLIVRLNKEFPNTDKIAKEIKALDPKLIEIMFSEPLILD